MPPDTAPDTVIHTDDLSKRFGKTYAVRSVSFEVQKGTIFGFMGPSGSGKTTTIRMLTGGYDPTSGTATVLGEAPSAFSLQTRARIGYMPQIFALYPDLTIWENLQFAASIYGVGLRRRKRLREVLDFVELTDHVRKPVRKISGGMQRRLSLAAALVHDPDLFFLDEPTTGLDPVLRQKLWERFHTLKETGKTLFVTTQYVNEAANCDRVGILVEGEILALDTPEHLRQKALGGDIVTLETAAPLPREFDSELEALPWVVRVSRVGPLHLRVTTEQAGRSIPMLMKWIEERGIDVTNVEEYVPPFDDAFVALVTRSKGDA